MFFGAVVFLVCHIVPAVDGMFLTFSLNIKEHLIILQEKLKESSFCEFDRNENKKILISLVKNHNKIIKITKKLSEAYAQIVFVQTLLTSVQVCVIGFQIIENSTDKASIFVNICFLFSIFIQLLIYCYGGAQITSESLNINIAVQLSQWNILEPAERKLLILVMLRAQKPLKIKSGLHEASMETFMFVSIFYLFFNYLFIMYFFF